MTLLTSKKTRYHALWTIVFLSVVLACPAVAQIGFQARLHDRSHVVSGYSEPTDRFSAALEPKHFAQLTRDLKFEPKLTESSAEQKTLTFGTSYRYDGEMVPLTVDADSFLDYRLRFAQQSRMASNFDRGITAARRGDQRQGLNIGLKLPKRFDRIFGEGGGNLKVSGYRRITFSGRSQWQDGKSDLIKQSKFPSLNMEQIYRFDITGTIGSKISVKVSEDSKSEVPLANRIQIRYAGDDDDILKSIEAGNTNLSLPNTKFVGYSSRIQGLFGLKAEAQLGNFRVIGIASQEKGSAEKATVSASGEESADFIRDYEYVQGRIFDLGYEDEFSTGDRVIDLEIYEYEKREDNLEAFECKINIYGDSLVGGQFPLSSQSDSLRMVQLDPSQYTFYNDDKLIAPYVVFNSTRYQNNALGAWMVIQRADGVTRDTIGDISGEVKILKSLRSTPGNYLPDHRTWDLMWRNIYSVPKGLSVEDLDIKIKMGKNKAESDPDNRDDQIAQNGGVEGKYIQILGLDQYNNQSDALVPDGVLDERLEVYRSDWGLIIFPHRTPFNNQDTAYYKDVLLADSLPNIYNYNSLTEKTEKSEYFIQVASKSRSNIITLNRANIIEGSERVTVNGQSLQRDVDYRIDYDFGRVTLLTPEASDPNASVEVDFEYAPFISVQKKTLLGMRAEYEMSRDFKIGTTFLYKSDKAEDRKPKVGQETAKMAVFDTDLSFTIRPNFITKAVNAAPLISTESPSAISVTAELARSYPNPNVNDQAYIDDFESANDQLSLGVTRLNWSHSSKPAQTDDGFTWEKGKILWHNSLDAVNAQDVYDRDFQAGEGSINPFRLVFRPKTETDAGMPAKSWGGIMRYYGARVDSKRAQLFEMRARGLRGKLHLDFGRINEDVTGEGSANNEDGHLATLPSNGTTEEEEDVGLDLLPDSLEEGYDAVTNPDDPAGDNYYFRGEGTCPYASTGACDDLKAKQDAAANGNPAFDSLYYEWLNGTEGNLADQGRGGRPDKENLSGYGLNTSDAYFSFVIDFSSDTLVVPGTESGDSLNPWKTYRIPIRDSLAIDTSIGTEDGESVLEPDWANISHVRVWFEAEDDQVVPDTIEIAAWYFVQSNWQDSLVISPVGTSNSNLVVATVSEEDNTFDPPPGVEAYEDQSTNTTETQRGLALIYENLRAEDTALAIKELISIEKYSGYQTLEAYVHGDEANLNDSVMFFFRLGENDSVFYEYRVPTKLYPGWDERNYVTIQFDEITALKDSAQRNLDEGQLFRDVDIFSADGKYRVKGDPNIGEIEYFAAGVVNLDTVNEATGEVWVDELRVSNVRKDVGTAGRLSVNGNMADFISYSFNYEKKDPYFRGISTATRGGSSNSLGSGRDDESYSYSATLNVQKLLPRSLGARIPVSFSYSKSTQLPLLRVRSDIVLPDEVRELEKTVSETKSFRVSESFRYKGKNPLFNIFLNRQQVSFSYSLTNQSSVNRPYHRGENYNIKANYDMGMNKPPKVPLFFFLKSVPLLKKTSNSRLSLFPSVWKWDGQFNRSLSVSDDIDNNRVSSLSRNLTGSMNLSYNVFENLTTTYNFTTKRDLSDPDRVKLSFDPAKLKLGLETNYTQNFTSNYDPKLFSFIGTKLSYSTRYSEIYERSTKTKKSDLSRTWGVSGSFKHIEFLGGKAGRTAGPSRSRDGRRNVRGGGAAANSKGKPFYDPPLAALRFLTGWIEPVSYKYNESFNNSLPGMVGRPSWKYRFGIDTSTDIERIEETRPPASGESQRYELSSGFKLLGGITTTVKFKEDVTRDLVKQGTRNKSTNTSWPDLSIRIQRFTTLPVIKPFVNKFIDIFSPKTSYSRQIKESFSIDDGFVLSKTESQNHNPLLQVNFKLLRALSFTGSYTVSKSTRETYNRLTGNQDNETKSEKKTLSFSSKYAFSAPGGIGLPLFGKLKFKSEVSISLSVRKNASLSETSKQGGPFVRSEDKSDITISPVISYTFSRQVKGGLTARWQDSEDNYLNTKRHARELQIWAEIRF